MPCIGRIDGERITRVIFTNTKADLTFGNLKCHLHGNLLVRYFLPRHRSRLGEKTPLKAESEGTIFLQVHRHIIAESYLDTSALGATW